MQRPRLLLVLGVLLLSGANPRRAGAAPLTTASYPPGWNLVGGPAGTVLNGGEGDLYTLQFKDTSYRTIPAGTALTGGLGYWAYFPNGGTADLAPSGPCVIAVPIGARQWVLVGNPSPSSTSTVRGVELAYTYDPASGYSAGVTLRPGQAALAYSSVATTVAMVIDGCSGANSVPPSPPVPP